MRTVVRIFFRPAFLPLSIVLLSISVLSTVFLPRTCPVFASPRCSSVQQKPLELLPTDHWAYEELRKLWVAGVLDSFFLSTRTVSRYDIASTLISLQDAGSAPAGFAPVERLLREFSREICYLREVATNEETGSEVRPQGETRSKATRYKETPFLFQRRTRDLDFRVSLYTDASVHKEGQADATVEEASRAGVQILALLRPGIVVFEDIYVGKHSQAWRYSEELFSLDDVIILSDRFYVSLRTRFFDAAVGRDKLRWGPGRTGTLLLSDTAPSYTLFSVSKTLGRKFKISTLSAILDSQEGKYLAGHRLDIAPSDFLQIGLSETAVYHSRFIEPLYAISLIPFTLVERLLHRDSQHPRPDDPLRNNVAFGADIVARLARGVSLYGELMLDDVSEETSERPTRLAYQLGAAISRLVDGRNVNAVAELSRVWNYTYCVSYTEFYDRDHSHQGVPLGYHLGPDSRHIFALLSCDVSRDLEAGVTWNEILRGEGTLEQPWYEEDGKVTASAFSGTVETERVGEAFVRWLPRDNFILEASAGLENIQNVNHVEGEDKSHALFSLSLAARW